MRKFRDQWESSDRKFKKIMNLLQREQSLRFKDSLINPQLTEQFYPFLWDIKEGSELLVLLVFIFKLGSLRAKLRNNDRN